MEAQRFFLKNNGVVNAFYVDQMTKSELIDATEAARDALHNTVHYTELDAAKNALSALDVNTSKEEIELYQIAVQRVEVAQIAYEMCDEYVALERIKSTKIWIPDDAVEMTEEEIQAHLNPSKTVDDQAVLANAECTKRINAHWNQIGQINASLGVYGVEDTANCAAWISSNRAVLITLLDREDLLEIDVIDDQYWPVFEDSSE